MIIEDKNDYPDKNKWEGLVRASILSATTQKLFGYVTLADQKAMGIIILNSIIIPVVIGHLGDDIYKLPATIAIITSVISILAAIICIFPKRRYRKLVEKGANLLHFNDIGHMSEHKYMDVMMPIYNDPKLLGQYVIKDLHDVSKNVLIPKFFWLKLSYIVFFCGNLVAVGMTLNTIWN